jgi:hypothetical protein
MASNAPVSALRKLLEERFSQLAGDAETLAGEAQDRARRECATTLNQAVRRIRQAESPEEYAATIADVSAGFATAAVLLRVSGENAVIEKIRGQSAGEAKVSLELENTEIALTAAPALASAIETRDPVVAVASAAEVSAPLMGLVDASCGDRVSIFPVIAGGRVVSLLYVWGTVEGPALELIAQAAGACWAEPAPLEPPPIAEPVPAPAAAELLVTIAPVAAPATVPQTKTTWDTLPPAEQQVHLRAQRQARVQVSELRLFHADAVQAGRTHRDLYDALRVHIDTARESFQRKFFATCPSMVDYLHLEILRTLANDDAELLGKDYPGPLV